MARHTHILPPLRAVLDTHGPKGPSGSAPAVPVVLVCCLLSCLVCGLVWASAPRTRPATPKTHSHGGAPASQAPPVATVGAPVQAFDTAQASRVPGPPPGWPVPSTVGRPHRHLVLHGFAPPAEPWLAGHRGLDLRATPGQPVRAAADGTVTFAGRIAGRGVVTVTLPGTGSPPLRTTYQPLLPRVHTGDVVHAGERIGVLRRQPAHCAGGCLHWGLKRGARYLNPLRVLGIGHARLYPPRSRNDRTSG